VKGCYTNTQLDSVSVGGQLETSTVASQPSEDFKNLTCLLFLFIPDCSDDVMAFLWLQFLRQLAT